MRKREFKVFSAAEIKKIRIFFCWSRADLADKVGVTPHAVKSWELGIRNPSVPVGYLLQGIEQEMLARIQAAQDDHSKGRAILKR